jgi:hypothetical protein
MVTVSSGDSVAPIVDLCRAYCRRCDYPLHGLPELALCPECGTAYDLQNARTFRGTPGRWKRVVRRWLIRAAVCGLVFAMLAAGGVVWIWSGWRAEQAVISQLKAEAVLFQFKPYGPGWCWRFYRGPLREMAMRVDLIDFYERRRPVLDGVDLTPLKQLKTVFLRDQDVTDAMVSKLAAVSSLEVLIMDWAPVDDAGLAKLSGLENLWFLDIKGSKVTDAGMAHLGKLTKMRKLDLSGTAVTEKGLEQLHGMTELELLGVPSGGVSERERERLKSVAPNIQFR